jgi:succinyl-CoA synthetase beta subunit
MRLLEHESKVLLREMGIDTPPARLAASAEEALVVARELGGPVVLKPQVPIGGRGKAGGLAFVSGDADVLAAAQRLLSTSLRGYDVNLLLVEGQEHPRQEFYLAVTYDPAARCPVLLASAAGGVEIEAMAGTVLRHPLSLLRSWPTFRSREVGAALGLSGRLLQRMTAALDRLVAAFVKLDALLVEINPLMLTLDGRLLAVDAHIELDADATFRHQDLVARFGLAGRGERSLSNFERQAAEIDHADHRGVAGRMVQFDGELGLLIGGGGASLTSFDAVLDAGLRPANYCEIGGNPSVWKVKELTKLILSQPNVERIAVIMNVVSNTRVDLVARGVIKGILELERDPATTIAAFRIPGSWEEEGFALLERFGVPFFTRETSIDEVVATIARGRE